MRRRRPGASPPARASVYAPGAAAAPRPAASPTMAQHSVAALGGIGTRVRNETEAADAHHLLTTKARGGTEMDRVPDDRRGGGAGVGPRDAASPRAGASSSPSPADPHRKRWRHLQFVRNREEVADKLREELLARERLAREAAAKAKAKAAEEAAAAALVAAEERRQKKRAKEADILGLRDVREVALLRQRLSAAAYTDGGIDWSKLFHHFDRDNSETLSFAEFSKALRREAKIVGGDDGDDGDDDDDDDDIVGGTDGDDHSHIVAGAAGAAVGSSSSETLYIDDGALRRLFDAVDTSGNGYVELDEFARWLEYVDDPWNRGVGGGLMLEEDAARAREKHEAAVAKRAHEEARRIELEGYKMGPEEEADAEMAVLRGPFILTSYDPGQEIGGRKTADDRVHWGYSAEELKVFYHKPPARLGQPQTDHDDDHDDDDGHDHDNAGTEASPNKTPAAFRKKRKKRRNKKKKRKTKKGAGNQPRRRRAKGYVDPDELDKNDGDREWFRRRRRALNALDRWAVATQYLCREARRRKITAREQLRDNATASISRLGLDVRTRIARLDCYSSLPRPPTADQFNINHGGRDVSTRPSTGGAVGAFRPNVNGVGALRRAFGDDEFALSLVMYKSSSAARNAGVPGLASTSLSLTNNTGPRSVRPTTSVRSPPVYLAMCAVALQRAWRNCMLRWRRTAARRLQARWREHLWCVDIIKSSLRRIEQRVLRGAINGWHLYQQKRARGRAFLLRVLAGKKKKRFKQWRTTAREQKEERERKRKAGTAKYLKRRLYKCYQALNSHRVKQLRVKAMMRRRLEGVKGDVVRTWRFYVELSKGTKNTCTTIQRWWRCLQIKIRRRYLTCCARKRAATMMQALWRGFHMRLYLAARTIQNGWRCSVARERRLDVEAQHARHEVMRGIMEKGVADTAFMVDAPRVVGEWLGRAEYTDKGGLFGRRERQRKARKAGLLRAVSARLYRKVYLEGIQAARRQGGVSWALETRVGLAFDLCDPMGHGTISCGQLRSVLCCLLGAGAFHGKEPKQDKKKQKETKNGGRRRAPGLLSPLPAPGTDGAAGAAASDAEDEEAKLVARSKAMCKQARKLCTLKESGRIAAALDREGVGTVQKERFVQWYTRNVGVEAGRHLVSRQLRAPAKQKIAVNTHGRGRSTSQESYSSAGDRSGGELEETGVGKSEGPPSPSVSSTLPARLPPLAEQQTPPKLRRKRPSFMRRMFSRKPAPPPVVEYARPNVEGTQTDMTTGSTAAQSAKTATDGTVPNLSAVQNAKGYPMLHPAAEVSFFEAAKWLLRDHAVKTFRDSGVAIGHEPAINLDGLDGNSAATEDAEENTPAEAAAEEAAEHQPDDVSEALAPTAEKLLYPLQHTIGNAADGDTAGAGAQNPALLSAAERAALQKEYREASRAHARAARRHRTLRARLQARRRQELRRTTRPRFVGSERLEKRPFGTLKELHNFTLRITLRDPAALAERDAARCQPPEGSPAREVLRWLRGRGGRNENPALAQKIRDALLGAEDQHALAAKARESLSGSARDDYLKSLQARRRGMSREGYAAMARRIAADAEHGKRKAELLAEMARIEAERAQRAEEALLASLGDPGKQHRLEDHNKPVRFMLRSFEPGHVYRARWTTIDKRIGRTGKRMRRHHGVQPASKKNAQGMCTITLRMPRVGTYRVDIEQRFSMESVAAAQAAADKNAGDAKCTKRLRDAVARTRWQPIAGSPKYIIAKWALRGGENVESQLVDAIPEEGAAGGGDGGDSGATQQADRMDDSDSSDEEDWSDTSEDEAGEEEGPSTTTKK